MRVWRKAEEEVVEEGGEVEEGDGWMSWRGQRWLSREGKESG